MKDFLKDTWVLGLALIIGGVIVYRNASEIQDEQAQDVPIPAVVVEEPVAEVVTAEQPQKLLYDGDEKAAAVIDARTETQKAVAKKATLKRTASRAAVRTASVVAPAPVVVAVPLTRESPFIRAKTVAPVVTVPDYLMPIPVNFEAPEPEKL